MDFINIVLATILAVSVLSAVILLGSVVEGVINNLPTEPLNGRKGGE